jgi:hypothetical protein
VAGKEVLVVPGVFHFHVHHDITLAHPVAPDEIVAGGRSRGLTLKDQGISFLFHLGKGKTTISPHAAAAALALTKFEAVNAEASRNAVDLSHGSSFKNCYF